MKARRAIYAGLSAAALLLALLFLLSPFPWLIVWMVSEELFPSTISWDGKTAWKRCDSAITGRTSWPPSSQGACAAMHLCANEAPLSEEQVDLLHQAIRKTPGCQEP